MLAGGFRAMPRHGLGPQPLHFLIFSGLVRENGESGSLRHSLRDSLRQQGRRSAPSNFRGVETPRFYRTPFPQTTKPRLTKKRERQSGVEPPHSKWAGGTPSGRQGRLRQQGRRSAPPNFRGVETPRFYRTPFPQTAKPRPTKKRERQSGVEPPHSKKAKAKATGCARKLRKRKTLTRHLCPPRFRAGLRCAAPTALN